uniref:18,6K protein n=1 Tax=Garlic latent virus TaxID=12458 RepID=Q67549_9VIRU|nr:18,6K protein [Garlic latent virus]
MAGFQAQIAWSPGACSAKMLKPLSMDPTMQINISLLLAVKIKLCDSGVPTDVAIGIIEPIIKEVRKLQRQEEQRLLRFNGCSRSAIKRRAKYLDKCHKCGKHSHVGPCSRNQTISNMEVEFLIRCGTIRYLTENPQSRKNSIYRSDYAKINRTVLRVYCRVLSAIMATIET